MESSNLIRVIRIVRERIWLVLLPAVVLTLTAVAVGLLQPSVYQGTVTILVTQQNIGTALL